MKFNIFELPNNKINYISEQVLLSLIKKRILDKKDISENNADKLRKKLEKIIKKNIDEKQYDKIKNINKQINEIERYIINETGWNLEYKPLDSSFKATIKDELKYHISGEFKYYKKQGELSLDRNKKLFYPSNINNEFYNNQRELSLEFAEKYKDLLIRYFNLNQRKTKILTNYIHLKSKSKLNIIELKTILFLTDKLEDEKSKEKYYSRIDEQYQKVKKIS